MTFMRTDSDQLVHLSLNYLEEGYIRNDLSVSKQFHITIEHYTTSKDMESVETSVSSTTFLMNLLELKSKLKGPLPTDIILYQCEMCLTNIPLNSCGSMILDNPLQDNINKVFDEKINAMKKNHAKQNEQCSSTRIRIHPVVGPPENICVTLPASDTNLVSDFQLEETCYKAGIAVVNSDLKAIFVLYQRNKHGKEIYKEFIKCNFKTFLDNDLTDTGEFCEEELIFDDESVHNYQQMLPRMIGGGRSLREDFNYVCLWCPKKDITEGKKGRFKELKNYRDHFRKYHHGEDGKGIPMSEFIKRLNRCEPTWFCKNCRQHYSLGNQVRHKAICQQESSDSESDIEEVTQRSKRIKTQNKPEKKDSAVQVDCEAGPSRRETMTESVQDQVEPNKNDNECNKINASQKETNEEDIPSEDDNRNKGNLDSTDCTRRANISVLMPETETDKGAEVQEGNHKRPIENEIVSSSEEKKKLKTAQFEEVHDEIYCSSDEDEPIETEKDIEIKIEITEITETDNELCPTPQKQGNLIKWWENVEKHLYTDRDMGGPKIFLPSDSEEFVKALSETYKRHMMEKSELDQKMKVAESGDAKFYQFSIERDQPFVDKYKKFVTSVTAKDVLHFFSDDYEEQDVPQSAKSSTAIQYTNRIMEFFKHMSSSYKNFHFDWMVDFKNKIEKQLSNGNVSKEIFIPTKQDVTDFIKQFKYGSNPAANCGVRIFALKKLMDFLSQEMKNNEQEFGGTLVDKSAQVECLLQKLRNLNSGICPEGTIKHLATASNKSHKRTLVEQLLKCPERSNTTIMKGVSEYVESEDYNTEKTKLMELAYKKTKVPTAKEYMNSTNWLLEMLVCIGGNRPCAILGITLRDWEERRPGYCPFYQNEDNDLCEEDPEQDQRKVLRNPYARPKGSSDDHPTGVIVKSETDKIIVGPPCYIWFPNALVDLVKAHALLTQKVLPRSVDIYHPKTRLFMNSNGKHIKTIECKHLKNFIGLPIVAYDFRRSLSTFVLESTDEKIRHEESSVLRHKEKTGYAYYYQKHSDKIEYVSIQYAMQHGLVKASVNSADEYCETLKKNAANEEWELTQKRTDKALEYSQHVIEKRKQSLKDAKQKGGRNWILPAEYESFVEGIEEAIGMEENKNKVGAEAGPFFQLLKYKPGTEGGGAFPPTGIWFVDMYRVLYGLRGKKGDEMRKAELSVYDGVPFSFSGRKKIQSQVGKSGQSTKNAAMVVANYWRDKIKTETRNRVRGRWLPLRFIFTEKDVEYHKEHVEKQVKIE